MNRLHEITARHLHQINRLPETKSLFIIIQETTLKIPQIKKQNKKNAKKIFLNLPNLGTFWNIPTSKPPVITWHSNKKPNEIMLSFRPHTFHLKIDPTDKNVHKKGTKN